MTGREVRTIRRKLRMTQAALAKDVGVNVNSVARWERDEIGIRESAARLLRRLLDERTRKPARGR